MGLGSQRDTLDCHFNYLNWGKYIMMGMCHCISVCLGANAVEQVKL